MTKRNGERPPGQGSFGFYGNQSMDDWLGGMGITASDPGETLPRLLPIGDRCQQCGGTFRVGDNAQRVRNGSPTVRARFVHLACLSTYQAIHGYAVEDAEDVAPDPLRAALAVQDFHDAYHVHGMKDAAGCLLCFDYDERHGQHDPTTGDDLDGAGCRDCDYPPNDDGWHRWDCPATADPRAAHHSI